MMIQRTTGAPAMSRSSAHALAEENRHCGPGARNSCCRNEARAVRYRKRRSRRAVRRAGKLELQKIQGEC